jgi:ammonia channel protein AmtB
MIRIKENIMKTNIKEKVVILIIAVLFAFIGFNLIVSPSAVNLIQQNANTDFEITYDSTPAYIT